MKLEDLIHERNGVFYVGEKMPPITNGLTYFWHTYSHNKQARLDAEGEYGQLEWMPSYPTRKKAEAAARRMFKEGLKACSTQKLKS